MGEFRKPVEQLAAKLATAHISANTFQNETAAAAIVQPIAMSAFVALNSTQTAFYVKARNPSSLNKAFSDALEVVPKKRCSHLLTFYRRPKLFHIYRYIFKIGSSSFDRVQSCCNLISEVIKIQIPRNIGNGPRKVVYGRRIGEFLQH